MSIPTNIKEAKASWKEIVEEAKEQFPDDSEMQRSWMVARVYHETKYAEAVICIFADRIAELEDKESDEINRLRIWLGIIANAEPCRYMLRDAQIDAQRALDGVET